MAATLLRGLPLLLNITDVLSILLTRECIIEYREKDSKQRDTIKENF